MDVWNQFEQIVNYPLIRFGSNEITLVTIFDVLIVVLISLLVAKLIQKLLRKRIFPSSVDTNFQIMIARVVGYMVFLGGILIGLDALGLDLTSLAFLAGALGVGIGFGLQNIVNNFVSGMIVLSERGVQIGDRIEVGGITGFIRNIGARSVTLTTTENLIVYVPNSEFVSKPVTRWSREENYPYRMEIRLEVKQGSDLKKVKQILEETIGRHPDILKTPVPFVGIASLTDKGVIFVLSFYSFERRHQEVAIKNELFSNLVEEFQKAGIEVSRPILEVFLKEKASS